MPPLPQFRGGSSVQFGAAPTPNVRASNVGELISEAGRAVGGIEDALRKKDDEDGRIWAAKTQTELRGKYNQRLLEAQNSGEDLNGLVDKIKGEVGADLQRARKAAPNQRGVYHLDLAAPDFMTDVEGAAFGAEARYRVTKRIADTESIIDENRNQIFRNPGLFPKAHAETKALIDSLSVPVEMKERLRQQMQAMGASAVEGMIENGSPYEAAKQLKSGSWNKYIDPDRLSALTNRAQNEIRSREVAARTVAAAESAAASAVLSVRINQFANGQGDDFGQGEIDKLKGSLTPAAWSTIQKQYDDARAKRLKDDEDRIDVAARIDAGVGIDPGNKKQVKAYDAYFRGTVVPAINAKVAELPPERQAAAASASVLDFVKKQGVIPETMLSSLRTSLRSGAADEKAAAAATVEQIKTVSPRALADIDDNTLRQANTISSYVDGGATPAEAVRMTEEAMRVAKGSEQALETEYNRLVKEEPTTDWLASAYDESWWGSPTVPIGVAAEVGALARNEYLRNGGNLESARRTALDIAKKRYGATRVNGAAEVVRNPIEQHYGLPWLTPDENAKAIKDEAVAEMNTGWTDGKLSDDQVRIRPYPAKGVIAADGRPAYAIEVQDGSGAWHVQMDLDPRSPTVGLPKPWVPSLETARTARADVVKGAIAEAKGEVPPGAIVEGTAVYDKPAGQPRKVIGSIVGGKYVRTGGR